VPSCSAAARGDVRLLGDDYGGFFNADKTSMVRAHCACARSAILMFASKSGIVSDPIARRSRRLNSRSSVCACASAVLGACELALLDCLDLMRQFIDEMANGIASASLAR